MAMNFDTYSTSFQSLMNPMYNVNANYSFGGGYAGGAGAYGAGGMNPAMMGMYAMGPMAGVGVGQFKADYLVKGDDQLNNYYARPIATHKKKDELPTILGILGTALGTAALITALLKGRGRRIPGRVNPPVNPPTPIVRPDVSRFGNQPYVAPKYLNPLTQPASVAERLSSPEAIKRGLNQSYTPVVRPDVSRFGNQPYVAPKYLNPLTQPASVAERLSSPDAIKRGLNQPSTLALPGHVDGIKGILPQHTSRMQAALDKQAAAMNLPSSGKVYTTPVRDGQAVAGYLPAHNSRMQAALDKQAAAMNLPSSGKVYTTPVRDGQAVAGYLPAHNSRMQAALDKQAAALNLPSSGKVYTTPLTPQQATAAGVMTPEAQAAYNRVVGQQFKPGLVKDAARKDAAWAFSKMETPVQQNTADNFIRPVITRKNNRFANINGAKIQNRMATIGMELDTRAFARLPKPLHREFNNILLNGTDAQLKAITCDPRFENVFRLV